MASEAGRSLARIQEFGIAWATTTPAPAKRLWSRPDARLFEEFTRRWPDLTGERQPLWVALTTAQRLVHRWWRTRAEPLASHGDHKPDNALVHGAEVIILDWDEAGPCDPRIEAVESALRWSWTDLGHADPELFGSFVRGYEDSGRPFAAVCDLDWAKWVAGIASWYEFKAQRSLGDWAAVAAPVEEEARSGADALWGLRHTIDQIPSWTRALNAGFD